MITVAQLLKYSFVNFLACRFLLILISSPLLSLIFFRIAWQMTADALTDNIQECAKNGMDNFIAKPVNIEKLEELLDEYVPSMDQEI